MAVLLAYQVGNRDPFALGLVILATLVFAPVCLILGAFALALGQKSVRLVVLVIVMIANAGLFGLLVGGLVSGALKVFARG